MNLLFTRWLLVVIFCSQSIDLVYAQTLSESHQQNLAKLAFQTALTNMTTRRNSLPNNVGLSYIQTELDEKGNGTRTKYNPHGPQQGSWNELVQYGEPIKSQLGFETPFLIEPSEFSAEQAQLVHTTESTWVFVIPNLVNVKVESSRAHKKQEREELLDNQLSAMLQTELVIDKKTLEFVSLHIFAKAPFKPSFLAKVDKFEVRMEFAEAWPNGPLISKSTSRSISGKYGFFITIEEFRTTTISDVKRVQLQ